jgi:Tetratricopeptide repeat
MEVQVMETTRRVLGEEYPSTLSSIANPASTYWSQGRWTKAEEIEVQVIETRRRILGKRASQHADHYEQSCIHYERARQKIRGHQTHGGVCTTAQPGPGY